MRNTLSVKCGGGDVNAWACTAAGRTRSSFFIDEVPADRSSRMKSGEHRHLFLSILKTSETDRTKQLQSP